MRGARTSVLRKFGGEGGAAGERFFYLITT